MGNTQILKKNPDISTRVFDAETVLIPLYSSSKEADAIYVLDDIATAVWNLINGKRDIARIEQLLLEEFDVSAQRLKTCVSGLVKDLRKIKALV